MGAFRRPMVRFNVAIALAALASAGAFFTAPILFWMLAALYVMALLRAVWYAKHTVGFFRIWRRIDRWSYRYAARLGRRYRVRHRPNPSGVGIWYGHCDSDTYVLRDLLRDGYDLDGDVEAASVARPGRMQ